MTAALSIRLGVAGWGFALFLAVNAVQVWGGVFPFLPLEFQTVSVTLSLPWATMGKAHSEVNSGS